MTDYTRLIPLFETTPEGEKVRYYKKLGECTADEIAAHLRVLDARKARAKARNAEFIDEFKRNHRSIDPDGNREK